MPWMETSPVEQRERFIRDHRLDLYAMAELCARYGISRKTGYKGLARFEEGGRGGVAGRPPVGQSPGGGRPKLLDCLEPRHPGMDWPAVSTAGDLLARGGLVKKRRRR